jgi:hypothetical protein
MNAAMRAVKSLLLVSAGVIVLFGLITLLALEGFEVVVVHTTDVHGQTRATRTWIADYDGFAWIEAANPEREFYRNIVVHPEIELERRGAARRYHAVPLANPDGHQLIRRLLAEKYGLADWWIGLIADTSRSLAIRLEAR